MMCATFHSVGTWAADLGVRSGMPVRFLNKLSNSAASLRNFTSNWFTNRMLVVGGKRGEGVRERERDDNKEQKERVERGECTWEFQIDISMHACGAL